MNGILHKFHPITQLSFIICIVSVVLIVNDPVILSISLICSLLYIFAYGGAKTLKNYLIMSSCVTLSVIMINPLISHRGMTVLFYLPDGNPYTAEALIYGFFASILISSTIDWFFIVNRTLNSEKIIYLFGKMLPKLALLISMTLGFFSKMKLQFQSMRSARKAVGCDISDGGLSDRFRNGAALISALIGWSLENSIDTADSMNSRGYGTHKRSSYSPYHFRPDDALLLSLVFMFFSFIMIMNYSGSLDHSYYPYFEMTRIGFLSVSTYSVYFTMCVVPYIIDLLEARKWKYIRSKI